MLKISRFNANWRAGILSSLMILALSIGFSMNASAQGGTGVVSGTVLDASTSTPLPFAAVSLVGTNVGTVADADGAFSISNAPEGSWQIQCTFVGYRAQTVDVQVVLGQEATVSFSLAADPFGLEEVVVTGVASRSSKAVAEIAIQRLDAEDLAEKATYNNVDDMLTGKIAGVSITKSSGFLGAQTRMNMRSGGGLNGDGQPVFYVDGIKIGGSTWRGGGNVGLSAINHINPEDIKSIEVIKGPAGAGTYGTGGSNGVVIITTKRGEYSGDKNWSVGYKGTFGVHQADRKYDDDEFRNYKFMNDYFQSGPIRKHQVSVTGGTRDLRMYFSYDNSKEEGHSTKSYMNQQGLRANFDFLPNEKFKLSVSTAYNQTDMEIPQRGRGSGEFGWHTFRRWPWAKVGRWRSPESFQQDHDLNDINSFVGSATAEWKPFALSSGGLKGLSGRVTIGVDDKNNKRTLTQGPLNIEEHNRTSLGYKTISRYNGRVYTVNTDIRYDYSFAGITASAVVGAQMFEEAQNSLDTEKSEFATELITSIGSAEIYEELGESNNHFKSMGIFTEHSFNYNNLIFASFMIRQDKASVFGTETSSIIYPRVSGALRIDQFDWSPDFISLLKLRTAYGETGILPERTWGIPTLWGSINSQYGVGADLSDIGNPSLTPERIKEWEIGFDAEISNFALDITYYRTGAEGSIIPQSNIPSSGITAAAPMVNIGKIEGSGFEVQLQGFWSGAAMSGWSAGFSLTGAHQQNEVTDMNGEIIVAGAGGGRQVYMEGVSKSTFWNPVVTNAIFATSTDQIVEEELSPRYGENAQIGEIIGVEDSGGPIVNGVGIPDWTGGLSLNFSAYGFTLYAMLQGKMGHVLYNEGRVDMIWGNLDDGGYYHGIEGGDWVAFNEGAGTQVYGFDKLTQAIGYGDCNITEVPLNGYPIGSQEYIDAANEWARTSPYYDANSIQKGDFVKLREISLSYDASRLIRKANLSNYIQSFSIGVVANNLWKRYHKEFTGIDSELNSFGYGATPQNMMQSGTMGTPRTISMFVNVRF